MGSSQNGKQTAFFKAVIVWDDEENTEEKHKEVLFCAFEDETFLREIDPPDDDIFHYGLTLDKAKSIVGKSGLESGEGDFTIVAIVDKK